MRASEIINHILNLQDFSRLKNINHTTKVLRLHLGARKNALVRYAYIRGNCLYIAVYSNHGLQELRHDSNTISIKNFLNSNLGLLKFQIEPINDVRVFLEKSKLYQGIRPYVPHQPELARGEFKLRCKDKKIKEIFEQIRQIVKRNYDKQND